MQNFADVTVNAETISAEHMRTLLINLNHSYSNALYDNLKKIAPIINNYDQCNSEIQEIITNFFANNDLRVPKNLSKEPWLAELANALFCKILQPQFLIDEVNATKLLLNLNPFIFNFLEQKSKVSCTNLLLDQLAKTIKHDPDGVELYKQDLRKTHQN